MTRVNLRWVFPHPHAQIITTLHWDADEAARTDGRYQGTDNGFSGPPAFNTTQDYINFANVTMRQRMATYIAGGGLPPLIGEWSFVTGEQPLCVKLGIFMRPSDPRRLGFLHTSHECWVRSALLSARCDSLGTGLLLDRVMARALISSPASGQGLPAGSNSVTCQLIRKHALQAFTPGELWLLMLSWS